MRTKLLMLALVIAIVAAATVDANGCRYIMGRCVEQCPEGTHSYNSNCRSPTWTQRTCENPEKKDMGPVCDLSRCDCDEPTVKDRASGKCVNLEDCPKN